MAIITKDGLLMLKDELVNLFNEEKNAVDAVVVARSFGDFSENAELEAANAWLERTRKKMTEIDKRIAEAEIFDVSVVDKTRVNFGAYVEVEDMDTEKVTNYKIVSDVESNIEEGKISFQSPIARALRGKVVGDECIVIVPAGEKILCIKKIDYSWLS